MISKLGSFKSQLQRGVIRNSLRILTCIVLIEVLALFIFEIWLSDFLLKSASIRGARYYSRAIIAARNIYSSEVVDRVPKEGVLVLPDYKNHKGAIPLPVNFTIELGHQISLLDKDVGVFLYSDFPFPWRKETGGIRDTFQLNALNALRSNPDKPYHEVQMQNGKKILRYAIADRMFSSCVSCHNSHPLSPKTDWKVGDVRGVLEVSRPIKVGGKTNQALSYSLIFIISICILEFFGLFVIFQALSARTQKLASEVMSRDDFISMAAHDLRSPLSSLLLNIQLNREMAQDKEVMQSDKLHEIFKKLEGQVKRLGSLIDNLLDVTRISSEKLTLARKRTSLSEVVKTALDQAVSEMNRTGSKVTVNLSPDVYGNWDPIRIGQVISNLINNALKYGEGNPIEIATSKTSSVAVFSIKDLGLGIPKEEREQVFEKFRRSTRSSGMQGLGLGLFISRGIVSAHGGKISHQENLPRGSIFTVELPLEKP